LSGIDPDQARAGSGDGRGAGMGQEADIQRSDEGNLIRRANLDDLDATVTIGIGKDLPLRHEVTDGAVIMGTDELGDVVIGATFEDGEGRRGVIQPGKCMQRGTEDSHPTIEGGQRGDQDLPSESSHPGR
jgi:hypothetical protein